MDQIRHSVSELSTIATDSLREPEDDSQFGLLAESVVPFKYGVPYGTITPPKDLHMNGKTATSDSISPLEASHGGRAQILSVDEIGKEQPYCTNCNKSKATKMCSGCKDAPLNGEGILHKAPSYCDAVCQSAHWNYHKSDCKLRQASKQVQALSRSGHLLSKLFVIWREACYDRPTVRVEVKSNSIYIYEDWYKSMPLYTGGRHRPLNNSLFRDDEIKNAVLANMGCDVSLAFIHDVIRNFLEEITTSVQEVEVIVKNTVRPIYIIDVSNGQCQLQGPHHVLKIRLKGGTFWAVDITAAQFGWSDIVTPWPDYFEKHCQRVRAVEDLGGRRAFFQKIIEEHGVAEENIRAFAAWTRSMGDIFGEIVDKIMGEKKNIKKFFNGTQARWRKREDALLKTVGEEMILAAQEADRTWSEQALQEVSL